MSIGRRNFQLLLGAAVALAAAPFALLPGSLSAQRAGDAEREAPEVREVRLEGLRTAEADELRQSIATDASRCRGLIFKPFCMVSHSKLWWELRYLNRDEFERDPLRIRVFYFKRGYRETRVDTAVARIKGGVRVTFRITEGEPTLVASVTVLRPPEVLSDRDVASRMLLRAGEPFNIIELDSSVVLLRAALSDKGYADAEVKPSSTVSDTTRTAVVQITADPKWPTTVQEIRIRGNQKIARETILNSLTMRPGSPYRMRDVVESQRNLYQSNLFRRAAIIVPPQGDSAKILEVTVQEAPLRDVQTSAGFNTVDFIQGEVRFTHYNWFGWARRLDLRAVVGNLLAPQLNDRFIFKNVLQPVGLTVDRGRPFLRPNWQLSADLTQPWFKSHKNSIGVSVFAHRRSAPGIFIDRGLGTSASFTRQLANRAPVTANYRFELTEVEASDVYFCVNYGVCEQAAINVLRGRQRLSPVALGFFTDRTNDLFFPTGGYTTRLDMEHASKYTVSDFAYNRAFGEVSKFWRVRRRSVLAARARAGWVHALAGTAEATGVASLTSGKEILHPRKRFYAGGAQSVRGYAENQLGPRILTIDPNALKSDSVRTDATRALVCSDETIAAGTCSPAGVPDDRFQPRPVGGSSLLEASVEYRFPIWKQQLGGAVFVDGAFVGQGALKDVAKGAGAVTPGFGVRYYTPAGAIRVDLGVRPTLVENLNVVTEVPDSVGGRRLAQLDDARRYDPVGGRGGFRQVLNRLVLHLSIGQAF